MNVSVDDAGLFWNSSHLVPSSGSNSDQNPQSRSGVNYIDTDSLRGYLLAQLARKMHSSDPSTPQVRIHVGRKSYGKSSYHSFSLKLLLMGTGQRVVTVCGEGFHPNHALPISYKCKKPLWHEQLVPNEIGSSGKTDNKRMTKHRAPSMRFSDRTAAHNLAYSHSLIPHSFNMQNLS
jgi:hypothetical protein